MGQKSSRVRYATEGVVQKIKRPVKSLSEGAIKTLFRGRIYYTSARWGGRRHRFK